MFNRILISGERKFTLKLKGYIVRWFDRWRIKKHPNSSANMEGEMPQPSLQDRYIAGMVLSGVGDALGYKNGSWEFCHSGSEIFQEAQDLGGLENIVIRLPKWMVSDDTVMHLATAEALVESSNQPDKETLYLALAKAYKECMKDMAGRAPGNMCMLGTSQLKPFRKNGYKIPFNPRGGGCGAAMRSMCIGLRYSRPEELDDLIAVSVESGRMTHHVPVGYLGSLAGALFTAYCVQGKPPISWGKGLLETLPLVLKYVKASGHCVQENTDNWNYFEEQWKKYLELRGISDGQSEPKFPEQFGFKERDSFVKKVSYSGWGGSSGHDAPMIAYDAFLGAGNNWKELCYRSMFHAGDSDSTGVMAACWFGVSYGFSGVPLLNYKYVEYRQRLEAVGSALYRYAYPDGESLSSATATNTDSQNMDSLEAQSEEVGDTQKTNLSSQQSEIDTERTLEVGETSNSDDNRGT